MDGRKPALRHLFVAALACTGSVGVLVADDFIRPPARSQPTSSPLSPRETTQPPVAAPIVQPSSQPAAPSPSTVLTPSAPSLTVTPSIAPTPGPSSGPTNGTTNGPTSGLSAGRQALQPPHAAANLEALPRSPQNSLQQDLLNQNSMPPHASPPNASTKSQLPPSAVPQRTAIPASTPARPGPTNLAPPLIPSSREQANKSQVIKEQAAKEQAAKEQSAREQAVREQAAREKSLRERSSASTGGSPSAHPRPGVPATTLNWQPRGGRGPNLHMSGYAQPAGQAGGASGKPSADQLSLSDARPSSVFVDPDNSAFALEDLPEVPPEVAEQADAERDVRLVMQPSALDSEQAEQLRSRKELAARISEELSAQRPSPSHVVAGSIEPGPGWQAVGEELKQHLSNCEQLLSRKAYLSAMEESNVAILKLVRVLDLRQNQLISEPAWGKAQQALREAQEFTSVQRVAGDVDLFSRLIQSHETPTLHGANTRDLTPLAAAQHYRAYAERCLVEASQGHPWFSELYYCKGRALQSQAESGHPQADNMLQTALTYFRAANTIQPTNAANANQLGYVLLRMDRATEAMSQLAATVQLPNCPLEAWQNIAQASSRLGDQRTQQWALQNYANLKTQGVQPSGPINTLVELDPRQFAALSPPTVGPHAPGGMQAGPMMNYSQGGTMMAPAPAPLQGSPATPNRTANTPRFGIFR